MALKKTSLFIILIQSTFSFSQSVRRHSNAFRSIGVDVAALAINNTVGTNTTNSIPGYWNLAGSLNLTDQQIALHSNLFSLKVDFDIFTC